MGTIADAGLPKMESLMAGESLPSSRAVRAFRCIGAPRNLAKLLGRFTTWRPESKTLGPLLAKEMKPHSEHSNAFHFGGASGYAGGCATYGSAGTGGTF